MSDGLRDPDLPQGALVEVRNDGTALRNDGKVLEPAGKNPWYVLMTVYGEQSGVRIDRELAVKNRRIWNGWACSGVDARAREALADNLDLDPAELAPWSEEETELVQAQFIERLGAGTNRPDPTDDIDMRKTHFSSPLLWEKWIFNTDALFEFATFSGDVSFWSTTFNGYADFNSAMFSGVGSFGHAKFCGDASFWSATFGGSASFGYTTFDRKASFGYATFSGSAWFGYATFSEDNSFGYATFKKATSFWFATFSKDASFAHATFIGRALFAEAVIKRNIAFTDCVFHTPATFREAKFTTFFPTFKGTILHETTFFSAEEDGWPKVAENAPKEGKEACAVIRHVVGKQSRPDDEHFFFRREMAFVERAGSLAYALPIKIYGWVSDYGYSIERPLMRLAWVIFGPFWLFIPAFLQRAGGAFDPVAFGLAGIKAVGLSFANVFAFLGFQRVYFGDFSKRGGWMDSIHCRDANSAWVRAVFFLGLGMRNGFRLK